MSKSFQIWDHFFPLLLPKDSENLKSLDIWLQEVGAKRPVNRVRKCDGQTNKQTDTHTDISTYRKNRPRGPILWKVICSNLNLMLYLGLTTKLCVKEWRRTFGKLNIFRCSVLLLADQWAWWYLYHSTLALCPRYSNMHYQLCEHTKFTDKSISLHYMKRERPMAFSSLKTRRGRPLW